jgi:hypothetical protein
MSKIISQRQVSTKQDAQNQLSTELNKNNFQKTLLLAQLSNGTETNNIPKCSIQKEIRINEYRNGEDGGLLNYLTSFSGLRTIEVAFKINSVKGTTAVVEKPKDRKKLDRFESFSKLPDMFDVNGYKLVVGNINEPFSPLNSYDQNSTVYLDPEKDVNLEVSCRTIGKDGSKMTSKATVFPAVIKYDFIYPDNSTKK